MKTLFIFLIFLFLFFYVSYERALVSVPLEFEMAVETEIEPNESLVSIAQELKEAGVIESKYVFLIYLIFEGKRRNVVAKKYVWDEPQTIMEVARLISEQELVRNEVTVTFLEGWTEKQMAEKLSKIFALVYDGDFGDDFLEVSQDTFFTYDFLASKPKNATLEGYLFPDTYRFFVNTSPEFVVRTILENFDAKLTSQMRMDISLQGKSIHEVVILASILEREVRNYDDKEKVANIFYKRLSAGMPLQADSTINYITGKKNASVSSEDLAIDSPFNTYKYRGLPQGPISNPGLDSLRASVYPGDNDFWYFLTSSNDGSVIYSKTFEEHVLNKAKYIQ